MMASKCSNMVLERTWASGKRMGQVVCLAEDSVMLWHQATQMERLLLNRLWKVELYFSLHIETTFSLHSMLTGQLCS